MKKIWNHFKYLTLNVQHRIFTAHICGNGDHASVHMVDIDCYTADNMLWKALSISSNLLNQIGKADILRNICVVRY